MERVAKSSNNRETNKGRTECEQTLSSFLWWHVQDVIVTSRWPYVCNVAKTFSGHKSRSPAYDTLISINNSLYHLKTLCNIPSQLNHKIQLSPSSTYNSMSPWKKSFCFNLMSVMLSRSMRISIRHLSKMTQPLVQCAGKQGAGRQETVEVEEEILGILCLPCAKQWAGTLKFSPQFCEAGNSPTGEKAKLRLRKGKQICYIHYSSWKGSKCFMEMTPWVVEGTCSRENKLENNFGIFNYVT